MLPAYLDATDNRRKCDEIRLVPPKSPVLYVHSMPLIAEWPCDPPRKITMFTNRSKIDGKLYDVLIDMPYKKFIRAYASWCNGEHIQKAFGKLSADIREFIQTGTTPAQWDEMFGKDED